MLELVRIAANMSQSPRPGRDGACWAPLRMIRVCYGVTAPTNRPYSDGLCGYPRRSPSVGAQGSWFWPSGFDTIPVPALFPQLEWRYLLPVSTGSLFVSDFVCRFRGQDKYVQALGYLGLCNALNLSSTSSLLVAVFQEGMDKRDLQARSLRPLPTSAGGGQIGPR